MAAECACTGLRVCALCQTLEAPRAGIGLSPKELAQLQTNEPAHFEWRGCASGLVRLGGGRAGADSRLEVPRFDGVQLVRDAVDEGLEAWLVGQIDADAWVLSQSGRRKQDWGPKVKFKKQRLSAAGFCGFPRYAHGLFERVCAACAGLEGFEAVEMACLEYDEARGAHIDYHIDDRWVWGERIVIVSLLSDSAMHFRDSAGCVVRVELPRRSALVIAGPARSLWQHAIPRAELRARRLSVTFRELAPGLRLDGAARFAPVVRELDRLALRRGSSAGRERARPAPPGHHGVDARFGPWSGGGLIATGAWALVVASLALIAVAQGRTAFRPLGRPFRT
jgi:alkylated DNA repair protein alkB family protein 4